MCFIAALAVSAPGHAAQTDITGPAGSVAFGKSVFVLPNGNFVVTDPTGLASAVGAVYLYNAGGTLISTLTGSNTNDHVGSGGVAVVGVSNFVVKSPQWNNGGAPGGGAVTWVNGNTGLAGVVSGSNSLVGSTAGDAVGNGGVAVLSNGNYVVTSSLWNNGVAGSQVGAVTWGDGSSGIKGAVSTANSLYGSTTGDKVGSNGVRAFGNGNFVVLSPNWNNGVAGDHVGAVTWGNGISGVKGLVSGGNSLIGSTTGDQVGGNGVVTLTNGNYVVLSPNWNSGVAGSHVGAATWGHGSSGITGPVSASNSLVGSTVGDQVGSGSSFVGILSNGNYVVESPNWNNGVVGAQVGAATWFNGSGGTTGLVSAGNSLIGTTAGDQVPSLVFALTNGNYVVGSGNWNNGVAGSHVGAATWGNGSTGISGPVSAGNSLIGTNTNDYIGGSAIVALSNGNYVVEDELWNNNIGAATWGNGSTGITGIVSAGNSLVGSTPGDYITGFVGIALSNGNYVAKSPNWSNGGAGSNIGAATWGNGNTGIVGVVSAGNSLVGGASGDNVGMSSKALSNGNYVVGSSQWNNGVPASNFGAVTWANGAHGLTGSISTSNSLVGTTFGDQVGQSIFAQTDGNYVVQSPQFNNSAPASHVGAVTLASGAFALKGTIQSWNSVVGMAAGGGPTMNFAYDAIRHKLLVGRPAENIVSVFTMDQIFADDFAQ
jgi:hypothetical protein